MLHSLLESDKLRASPGFLCVGLLDFLLLRDQRLQIQPGVSGAGWGPYLLMVGRTPQGDASSWLVADVRTHKRAAHASWRKPTASVLMSKAKRAFTPHCSKGLK